MLYGELVVVSVTLSRMSSIWQVHAEYVIKALVVFKVTNISDRGLFTHNLLTFVEMELFVVRDLQRRWNRLDESWLRDCSVSRTWLHDLETN